RLFATSSTVSPLLKEFEIFGELFESFNYMLFNTVDVFIYLHQL
ncbi:unnamed protein product, partial [Brassica oleracea var. botrytis]